MPKISVVIPVYNVEKYLSKCIDSVLNQTLSDIEIILVNDGSKDLSGEICERYSKADGRIKYICQENQGVVTARKNGMEYVTSEYVTFVDSDDWISETFFEELYNNINGCDLVLSGHYKVKEKAVMYIDRIPKGIYDTPEKMKYITDNILYSQDPHIKSSVAIFLYMCSRLYKSEIAREIFKEIDTSIFFSEDVDFLSRYILRCRSVNCTDICGYYYLDRSDSCMNTKHDDYLLNLHNLYNSLRKAFEKNEYSDSLIKQLQLRMTNLIFTHTPGRMGFHPECMIIKYISPFLNKIEGRKTALYGAGDVGKNYYLQMKKSKGGAPSVWVDRNYELYNNDFPVHPVEELKIADFDYIIIAVENEKIAESIRQNLIGMGFDENKILWEEPIKIYNP